MTVTKQQQLERISRIIPKWNDAYMYAELMTNPSINMTVYRFTDNPSGDNAFITRAEWYMERDRQAELKAMTMQMCELKPLERDKMSSKPEVDNSLRKRGARPPIGAHVELWFGGSFAYNCEFICARGRSYIVWNLDADRPDCADIMNSEFRPLRTEREKAIDDMKSLRAYPGSWCSTFKAFAESLYDAGYRKVNP